MEDQLKFDKSTFVCYKTTKINEEYLFGETLGQGAFGTVRKAVHKLTGQERAIKILKKRQQDERKLFLEVNILSKLAHPNIMEIYEFFEDKANFYIVSELCKGGELFDKITEKGCFKEAEACPIMLQLVSAICYSHSNNIVHRDLKPENIMLENSNQASPYIKLIDWGGARYFSKNKKMSTIKGTPYYIAPEVIKEVYDEKCDIWSLGVILYVLLCGYFSNSRTPNDYTALQSLVDRAHQLLALCESGNYVYIQEDYDDLVASLASAEPLLTSTDQDAIDRAVKILRRDIALLEQNMVVGISGLSQGGIGIGTRDGRIVVENLPAGATVNIYSLAGRPVATDASAVLPRGVYVVRINVGKVITRKVTVR
ncbi:MAG: protein kinase [Bacteroidales bacterium]|nr:protein kinase [Bacteroidales bacterium]